jgi:hypothetical protein
VSRLKAAAERLARQAKPAEEPIDPVVFAAEEFASAKTPAERAEAARALVQLVQMEKSE